MMGGPETASLEAYTTLAFLAAHTSSVRLMTVVTVAHFRHPAILAKTVTTLDVLSGGRAWLGIEANAQGSFQGRPTPESIRATLTLVNDAERWQLAGIHMSFIAGTPGAPPILQEASNGR